MTLTVAWLLILTLTVGWVVLLRRAAGKGYRKVRTVDSSSYLIALRHRELEKRQRIRAILRRQIQRRLREGTQK